MKGQQVTSPDESAPETAVSEVSLTRDAHTAALFDAMASGHLPVAVCRDCEHVTAATTLRCPACTGDDLRLTPSTGRGAVASWSTTHDRAGAVRTSPGIVELDEGAFVFGALTDPALRRVGARVQVAFRTSAEGEHYPVFVPEPLSTKEVRS